MSPDRRQGPLDVRVEERSGAVLVTVGGELDLNVSPKLRQELKRLTAGQADVIVVDLSGVTYIDSSGVATLVECLQGASRYGGKLRLASPARQARSVFEISRLDTVFDIRDSIEEALEA